ncbi:hypothetical protein WJX75_004822 [Coccomyxa subellipsoidea]|uniref:Small-subunit processome Utp12 domain-containing protein n=1 Tax=Coccomyxa subellipsoidea TaxID=248742 RepID=A0ABR2YTG1_9CHLO
MDYKFANLLGAPYRGGNLILHGTDLLSAVGNRISSVDLTASTSSTLPFEALKQIRTLCLSPDGGLLLAIDEDGRSLLINRRRRVLLHHFSFKGPVAAARFSPDGQYIACAVGRLLQIWRAPGYTKTTAPMQLHRTYGGCAADITSLDWSEDSEWIAVASKDLSARVFSLHQIEGYRPPMLSGHKDMLVGVFFVGAAAASAAELDGAAAPHLLTVSRDGALFAWQFHSDQPQAQPEAGANGHSDEGAPGDDRPPKQLRSASSTNYAEGRWQLAEKHFFNQRGARLTALDYHKASRIMVVAFSSGIFDIYQLPAFENVHMLSVSREAITAVTISQRGDWVALGCAALGQLLVWEWRSESYVLKQQGHHYDVSALAFSPDGSYIATGADDNKVKLWTVASGFCFVTFSEHTAPVTAVSFLPTSSAAVSASMDGTVRAWDLLRYRNFRTMTSPTPVQFASLAVDPAGEVVCAGSLDTFQIFVWSVKTARLLDVLAAHEGPVVAMAFSPTQPLLASASWDKTVRTWDVFSGKGGVEVLQHTHDVLAVAWAPSGKLLASATLDGQIYFWDPLEAQLQGTIEGRRDIAGGRLASDRRAAGNRTSGQCFTSLAFSADGSMLLAAGASKFVCLYDVEEKVLLRRVQISANRSLDGVLDQLNSRHLTDAGPAQLLDDAPDDEDLLLPPTTAGGPAGAEDLPGTGGKRRPAVRSRAVALSPTGRSWAAATTDGLLLYSLDPGAMFDPTDLADDVTPQAARRAMREGAWLRALLVTLRLKDAELLRLVILGTPPQEVDMIAGSVPTAALTDVLAALAEYMTDCPHLEFLLKWVRSLCLRHGTTLQAMPASRTMPVFRALQQAVTKSHEDLASACDTNLYTLRYLAAASKPALQAPQLLEKAG